jgi:hypothetical protein
MGREVRHALIGVVLLSSFVLLIQFQSFLYPTSFARWRAIRIMDAHCRQSHMNTKSLVGPVRQHSPLGTWCFRWAYSDASHQEKDIIDVVLRWDGSSDLGGERVE